MRNIIRSKPLINEKVTFRIGKKKMKIHVMAYVDDIIDAYDKAQERLSKAENLLKADASMANTVEYGAAAAGLMQVVFGDECAAAIIKCYEGRHIQMLADVYPFIQKKILPKLNDPFGKVRIER